MNNPWIKNRWRRFGAVPARYANRKPNTTMLYTMVSGTASSPRHDRRPPGPARSRGRAPVLPSFLPHSPIPHARRSRVGCTSTPHPSCGVSDGIIQTCCNAGTLPKSRRFGTYSSTLALTDRRANPLVSEVAALRRPGTDHSAANATCRSHHSGARLPPGIIQPVGRAERRLLGSSAKNRRHESGRMQKSAPPYAG
jgi:hypothetical protein